MDDGNAPTVTADVPSFQKVGFIQWGAPVGRDLTIPDENRLDVAVECLGFKTLCVCVCIWSKEKERRDELAQDTTHIFNIGASTNNLRQLDSEPYLEL